MDALSDISHTIELAVAPVFLLAGIGAILSVVTARLGRAVDRARALELMLGEGCDANTAARIRNELSVLDRRMLYAQRSITLCSLSALLVCLLVGMIFVADFAGLRAAPLIAASFVASMAVLIGGLVFFLAEISLATRMLRVRAELLMKD